MILILLMLASVFAEPVYVHVTGLGAQPNVSVHHQANTEEIWMLPNGKQDWVGVFDAPSYQYWNIEVEQDGIPLYHSIIRQQSRHIYLGYDLHNKKLQYHHASGSRQELIAHDKLWLWYRLGWFLIALVVVEGVARLRKKTPAVRVLPFWTTPMFFLLLSMVWLRAYTPDQLSGVHYDTLGTYWLMNSAPSWEGIFDPLSNRPEGVHYRRLDSFVLYAIALIFSWVPTPWLFGLLSLIALSTSGWAASKLAQEYGADRGMSWLAGIAYSFNGFVASALLEGHIYHLLQPWLPLCLIYAHRAFTRPSGNQKNGVLMGIFWGLCLLSSAYIGLCASIALLAFGLYYKVWQTISRIYGGAVLMVVVGLLYIYLYQSGAPLSSGRDASSMMISSLNLSNFWGYTPQVDRALHAQSLGMLAVPFALALLAHHLVPYRNGRNLFLLLSGLSLLFALGCFVSFDAVEPIFPMPLLWLKELPILRSIGFPIRLAWPFLLGVGVLAALSAQSLKQRAHWVWVLLVLCTVESVVSPNLKGRQLSIPYEAPEVLVQSDGASLELYPVVVSGVQHSDLPMWFSAQSCFWQTFHKRGISENCVTTIPSQHKRVEHTSAFLDVLFKDTSKALEYLREAQFSQVVLFPDLYHHGDYIRIKSALSALEQTKSSNGGLYTEAYQVPSVLQPVKESVQRRVWGKASSGKMRKLKLRIQSDNNLSYILLNQERHSLKKEPVTDVYYAYITQDVEEEATLLVYDTTEKELWSGVFFPAVEKETLCLDTAKSWQLCTPYTGNHPINKEVGSVSRWLWLIFLGGLVLIEYLRHRYPLKRHL